MNKRQRKKLKNLSFDRTVGDRLKKIRISFRISQEVVGKILGVHQSALCRIENGSQRVTVSQLKKFSDHMGVAIASFFG